MKFAALVGLFAVLALLSSVVALPQLIAANTSGQEISAALPVKNVVLFSNGFGSIERSGSLSVDGASAHVFIKDFSTSAILGSIGIRSGSGWASEIGRYERNVSKNESKLAEFSEILNASLGKNVSALTEAGRRDGVLRWFDGERIGIAGGSGLLILRLSDIQEFLSPSTEYEITKELNESERGLKFKLVGSGAHAMNVSYLVNGVSWKPDYKFYLATDGEKGSASMSAWGTVSNNGGEEWKDVNAKLVVGYPNIVSYVFPIYKYRDYASGIAASAEISAPQATPSVLGEYYVYALPEPVSIASGEEKSFSMFGGVVPYKREYVWDTNWQMPHKIFKFNNTGTESWASGVARVYVGGEFIGEDSGKYTAKGKEMEVYVSDLADVLVKKETLDSETVAEGTYSVSTYSMKLTIENTKQEAVSLTVRDTMYSGDKVELISSKPAATMKPGNVLEWSIGIASGAKAEISYTYKVSNIRKYGW